MHQACFKNNFYGISILQSHNPNNDNVKCCVPFECYIRQFFTYPVSIQSVKSKKKPIKKKGERVTSAELYHKTNVS